jgi:pheromone shutdown protein TraB
MSIFSSYADEASKKIPFDIILMLIAYVFMFIYTMFVLGKINMIEVRCYLAMAGIIAVGMGLTISIGLSMAIGLSYTPIHGMLPFLALGMFNKSTLIQTFAVTYFNFRHRH